MIRSQIGLRTMTYERWLYVAIAMVFFTGLFVFRVVLFSDTEPSSDQAFFSWWVQGLSKAEHVFPSLRSGESFLVALERDEHSFLHRLLRPIHSKSVSIFTTIPLALRLIAAWVFGDGIEVQTISSIFAGTLIIIAIGLFPVQILWSRRDYLSSQNINGLALLTVIFISTTYYFHYFSPLGNHNFGVLFLVLAVSATQQAICFLEEKHRVERGFVIITLFLQFLAFYSHWTNIFLLPTSTLLVWAFSSITIRRKTLIVGYYFTFLLIIASPFLLLAVNDLGHSGNARSFTVWDLLLIAFGSGGGDYLEGVGISCLQWFKNLTLILSDIGLGFGLLGTLILAIHQRIFFPLGLCVTHFLIAIMLPIFMGAHLRTDLYVLPFLILGLAYLVVLSFLSVLNFWRSRGGVALAMIGVVIIGASSNHLWQQMSKIGLSDLVRQQNPEFWSSYYKGQGEVRPIAQKIDKILPESAVIFTWGYGMQFFVRNYGIEDAGRKVMPSLLTLISRFDNSTLSSLIKRRDLSIQTGKSIYVIVDHEADRVDRENLQNGITNILGPKGFELVGNANIELQRRWRLSSPWPREIAVYLVDLK